MNKLIFLFITVVILSCGQDGDIESIIINNNSKWVKYYNQGNFKGIALLHTIDAVVMPPKSDFVVGRNNIEQMYKSEIEMGKGTLDLKTKEVVREDFYAYETGLYQTKMSINGEKVFDYGKYIVVWEKQKNGDWLCKKDIWNTSLID